MEFDWAIAGGFASGALAGSSARFGRLCTMSAVEDALIGRDYRGAMAWLFALLVAISATQGFQIAGLIDAGASRYAGPDLQVGGLLLGGFLFGLGMTLVGTCSFGLIVRAGSGDMRAALTSVIVGVSAFAATAGILSYPRLQLASLMTLDFAAYGGTTLRQMSEAGHWQSGLNLAIGTALAIATGALLRQVTPRQRPRLLAGALGVGMAIVLGWLATTAAVTRLSAIQVESLSFVAPVGRGLLMMMGAPIADAGFGVAAAVGVLLASFGVSALRRELRWEAFDDPTEMRRHLAGAVLMGFGGVLAQGCTVGQGLTAASLLALSAPVFIVGVLVGARTGLKYLIEGTALWRLGFSPREDR